MTHLPLTVGTDPEFFVFNTKTKRNVAAEDHKRRLVPGDKKNPHPVKGGAIQVDGTAIEVNTDPATDFKGFYSNLKSVIFEAHKRVKEYNDGYQLNAKPSVKYLKSYYDKLPDHTKIVGCDPDWNVHKMELNPVPAIPEPFAFAGGHLQLGFVDKVDPYSEGHMKDCEMLVKEWDKYYGYAASHFDKDKKRKEIYPSGSFRPKPFGVEYRAPSNAWLQSPELIHSAFCIFLGVARSIDSGKHNFKAHPKDSYGDNPLEKTLNSLYTYTQDL